MPEGPEGSPDAPEEKKITASGKLRPYPMSEPYTTWSSDPEPAVPTERRREVGSLEQRSERRRRAGVRRVYGLPPLQAVGWSLLFLGGLIYLHGLWVTSNAVIAGRSDAEQVLSLGTFEILQGTLGLLLAGLGLLVAVLFAFLPVRDEPRLVPGTLEFEVAAENLLRGRLVRRILIWVGVVVFLAGLALAAFALRESIAQGELYRWSVAGSGVRIHLVGYLLAAIGLLVALPLALAQGTVERAAALAEGALTDGRVRRVAPAEDRTDVEGDGDVERDVDRVIQRAEGGEDEAPEATPAQDADRERRLHPIGGQGTGSEEVEDAAEEDARRWPRS